MLGAGLWTCNIRPLIASSSSIPGLDDQRGFDLVFFLADFNLCIGGRCRSVAVMALSGLILYEQDEMAHCENFEYPNIKERFLGVTLGLYTMHVPCADPK